jgi:Zn-finger nucleic acid-binding protein
MIYNIVSFPILNPCETVFLQLKTLFKGIRLNRYQAKQELQTEEMIQEAIDRLDNDAVKRNCRYGHKLHSMNSLGEVFDHHKYS